jgi:hypothetical protein
MGIDYMVSSALAIDPESAIELALACPLETAIRTAVSDDALGGLVQGEGFTLSLWVHLPDEPSMAHHFAMLGFRPVWCIIARLDSHFDLSPQQDCVLDLVQGLLRHSSDDLALQRDWEQMCLTRRASVLYLDPAAPFWTEQRLRRLEVEYSETNGFLIDWR